MPLMIRLLCSLLILILLSQCAHRQPNYRQVELAKWAEGELGFALNQQLGVWHPGQATVRANIAGEVQFIGEEAGQGVFVVVRHSEDLATVFGHLGRAHVKIGQWVTLGQTIGVSLPGYSLMSIRDGRLAADPRHLAQAILDQHPLPIHPDSLPPSGFEYSHSWVKKLAKLSPLEPKVQPHRHCTALAQGQVCYYDRKKMWFLDSPDIQSWLPAPKSLHLVERVLTPNGQNLVLVEGQDEQGRAWIQVWQLQNGQMLFLWQGRQSNLLAVSQQSIWFAFKASAVGAGRSYVDTSLIPFLTPHQPCVWRMDYIDLSFALAYVCRS